MLLRSSLLMACGLSVMAANCVSNGDGNWSASGTWTSCGGGVPGVGDTASVGHAVTVDVNTTVGNSNPAIYSGQTLTAPTLSQSAGGGSLPAGSYRVRWTNVDSGGKESAVSVESSAFTLTATNTLIVTLPSLPTGITSRNIYLTAASGASGSETLYSTGNTTTTANLTSASWTDGTTTQAAAVAYPNGFAITITAGSVTVATGVTLVVAGDVLQGNGAVTLQGNSVVEFDPSVSTTSTYKVLRGTANSQNGNIWQTSGTSADNPATIRGKSGYTFSFMAGQATSGGGNISDSQWFNLSYVNIFRCGDTVVDCMQLVPSSSSNVWTFYYVIWDTSGRVQVTANAPTTGGWSFDHCTFKNTNAINVGGLGMNPIFLRGSTGTLTGTRSITNSVFDTPPWIIGNSSTYTGNVFLADFYNPGSTNPCAAFTGNFVRVTQTAGVTACGDFKDNYVFSDNKAAATVTGTATAGGASTLTDSGKSWSTNAYAASGSAGWMVAITGGTGVNQIRSILSNTSTALTVLYPWDTTPDATSTYAIYNQIANTHPVNSGAQAAAFEFSGNIFETLGADNNGDCFLHMDQAGASWDIHHNIILPNGMNDNSCTLMTVFSSNVGPMTIDHNTAFTGAQGPAVVESGNGTANTITSYKSNIFWADPARTYKLAGGGGATSTLGPYKANTTSAPTNPATNTADIITAGAANYNSGYGQLVGYELKGYNYNATTVPGANDVDADPQFTDSTRKLWTWGVSLGVSGSVMAATTATISALANLNEFDGRDASFRTSGLIAWVRSGYAPRNALLYNAGHDGETIGAVAYSAGFSTRFLGTIGGAASIK